MSMLGALFIASVALLPSAFVSGSGCDDIVNGTVTIAADLDTIPENAYIGCSKLKYVNFEEGSQLRIIGETAFHGSGLRSIEIPSKVVLIHEGAFQSCHDLTSVTFGKDAALTDILDDAFQDCPLEAIELPSNLRTIGNSTFESTDLKSISFGDSSTLESIGSNAFMGTQLERVDLPSSLETLQNSAFESCGQLKVVNFAAGINLAKIDERVFYKTPVESIIIPAAVVNISAEAFHLCTSLLTVTFQTGSHLNSIEKQAFFSANLTGYLNFPGSLRNIDPFAFAYNPELKGATFQCGNKVAIGNNAFEGTSVTNIAVPSSSTCDECKATISYLCCPDDCVTPVDPGVAGEGSNAGIIVAVVFASLIVIAVGTYCFCVLDVRKAFSGDFTRLLQSDNHKNEHLEALISEDNKSPLYQPPT